MARLGTKCRAPKCPRPVFVRKHGLCEGHYKRYTRTGSIGAAPIGKRKPKRSLPPWGQGETA